MPWGFGSGRAQSLTERGRSQTGRVRLPTNRRQGFMTPFKQAKPASPPPPSCTYFLRRPDWPWKATQDAATKLVQGGGLRAAVSGKHALDTPPHGRPCFASNALGTPPRGRHSARARRHARHQLLLILILNMQGQIKPHQNMPPSWLVCTDRSSPGRFCRGFSSANHEVPDRRW